MYKRDYHYPIKNIRRNKMNIKPKNHEIDGDFSKTTLMKVVDDQVDWKEYLFMIQEINHPEGDMFIMRDGDNFDTVAVIIEDHKGGLPIHPDCDSELKFHLQTGIDQFTEITSWTNTQCGNRKVFCALQGYSSFRYPDMGNKSWDVSAFDGDTGEVLHTESLHKPESKVFH